MKKTIYILILLFLVSACKKFLDEPIRGVQTIDNYFTTDEECESFLIGCYQGMFQDDWWKIQFVYLLNETATDDSWLSNPTQAELDYKVFSQFQMTSQNDYLYPFWEYMYKTIFQCNMALEGYSESPVNETNPNLLARLTGEVKFIRAYCYFELAKNFREIPILTSTMSPDELNSLGLSTQEEIYNLIISDLHAAVNALPQEYPALSLGRATKGAAWAYLSKAYLYIENWQQSKAYADSVINSGMYYLEPVFGDIWDINNRNGIESIFELQTNYNPNYETGNSMPILTGGREDHGWYYCAPTSHLENAYLEIGDTIRLRATIISAYNEETAEADGVGKARVYDTDGSTISVNSFDVSRLRDSKSMRINRKFYVQPQDRMENYGHSDRNRIPKNHIFIRLAEVKLNRAEAMWHMIHTSGNATFSEADIINGDLQDIRSRVNLPNISSSGDQLLLDIYNERRLEMAGELKRWDDIRRAKHPSDKLPLIYHIMGSGGSFVNFNLNQNTDWWEVQSPYANREPNDKGINFSSGDEWLPIPAHDAGFLGIIN
jgi:hypothetical protein